MNKREEGREGCRHSIVIIVGLPNDPGAQSLNNFFFLQNLSVTKGTGMPSSNAGAILEMN